VPTDSPSVPATDTTAAAPAPATESIPAPVATPPVTAAAVAPSPSTATAAPNAETPAPVSSSLFEEPGIQTIPVSPEPATPVSSAETTVTVEPAGMNPPVNSVPQPPADISVVPPVAQTPVQPATVLPEPAPVTEVAPLAPEKEPSVESASVSKIPAQKMNLPYITSFVKDSFYVQIASYSDPVHVKNIVEKYGKKYPIAVERSTSTSGEILKVFIGPVQKDEYGAVLDRFKNLGFKDSFVKKS
jgi:hypothetical protein